MTYWDVPQGRAVLRVSAGAPMEGSKVVLMDLREQKLAASLEPAEIAFGGPFIARGYLQRPAFWAYRTIDDVQHRSRYKQLSYSRVASPMGLLSRS